LARRKPLPHYITIGRVTSPHGWRGAVRVEPFTDFPERFHELKSVYVTVKGERLEMEIEEVKGGDRVKLIKFSEINTLEEAEAVRGALLEVPRESVRPLPPGHYYVYEVIDLPVYTEEGKFLGYVEEVLRTQGNDVYVVRGGQEAKEILLPATSEVILAIDLKQEEIRVRLLPGLVD